MKRIDKGSEGDKITQEIRQSLPVLDMEPEPKRSSPRAKLCRLLDEAATLRPLSNPVQ